MHPGVIVGSLLTFGNGHSEVYLVYDLDDVQQTLAVVQRSLLIGGLALLVLIGAVAMVVSSLVVAPLKQAAATSEQLAEGHLEQRIPERGDDVVATLARSFNRMAENLQRQITQLANLSRVQQRFVSDVSHELRTPLTTIRLASDVLYDARDRYDAPSARSAELLKAQVERFELLLADLLEISRMDAHAADLSGEPTNLVDLVREGIDSLGGLAEATGTDDPACTRPAATPRSTWMRGASRASCGTCSRTPSSTARAIPSTSRSTARRPRSRSACGTTASGWTRATRSGCSTGSGARTPPGSGGSAARGSGSRSASRTRRCTAARSRSGAAAVRARTSC